MTHPNWINELFQAIDRKYARSFASFLTEEGVFRYGSQPAVKGRVAVERYVTGFFGMLSSLRHQILDFHANDPDGICYVRGDVTYTLAGGRDQPRSRRPRQLASMCVHYTGTA